MLGSLFSRQLECPAGTFGCPNDRCCYTGQACTPDGCCDSGEQQCSTDGCYNAETEVCCNDGTHCPLNYECFADGCCPTGQQPCGNGSGKCYSPATQKCCGTASAEWACSPDQSCCDEAESCASSDEICCPDGSCPDTDTCCAKECCRSIARCGSDGYCSAKVVATTQRQTSTSTRSSTTSSTSSMKITSSCATPTLTAPQVKTETISFVYDPNRSWVARSGPNAGQTISGSNEAIISNMCDGINEFNKGTGGNTITLTHGGKCFQKQNRKVVCPKSWCAKGVQSYIQSMYPKSAYPNGPPTWATDAITAAGDMSCDEFPFASSIQGGTLQDGVRICVPSEDNGWQGRTMASFFNPNLKTGQLINVGENYVVEISGWDCDAHGPAQMKYLQARDAFSGDGVDITGPEMYHGFDASNPTSKLMSMPLGDLDAGSYSVNINVAGGALNFTLVDYNGQTYAFTQSGNTISFDLDDDTDQVSLTGTTYSGNVSVRYSASSAGSSSATSSSASSTATAKSEGIKASRGSYELVFGSFLGTLFLVVL